MAKESTQEQEPKMIKNPVYYYRGDVNNNNVKFANYCWKIVRTTSAGGIKMIYNGLPDENGYCDNTGDDTTIGMSQFNNYTHILGVQYMLGKITTWTQ